MSILLNYLPLKGTIRHFRNKRICFLAQSYMKRLILSFLCTKCEATDICQIIIIDL